MYRALERQRASARLLNWNFCIARPAASSSRFVVNDLGYSLLGLAGPDGGREPAMVFPLAPDLAMITTHDGGRGSYVAGADGTSSFRAAEMTLVDSDVRSVNRDSCFVAWREMYADTMRVLSELGLGKLRPEPQPSPLSALMLKSLGPGETDFWQNEIIRLKLAHLILILEA